MNGKRDVAPPRSVVVAIASRTIRSGSLSGDSGTASRSFGQLGDDVQVADVPEVIDQAQARRNEARIEIRRAQVRVQRGRRIAQLLAQDLRLAIEGGGAA